MRVTVDGRFLEAALKRGIKPKLWNEKKQRSNGRDRLSLELNDFLDDTQTRILRIHQRFIDERKEINPKTILDEFAGRMERPKMLREIFKAEMPLSETSICIFALTRNRNRTRLTNTARFSNESSCWLLTTSGWR